MCSLRRRGLTAGPPERPLRCHLRNRLYMQIFAVSLLVYGKCLMHCNINGAMIYIVAPEVWFRTYANFTFTGHLVPPDQPKQKLPVPSEAF